MKPSNSPSEIFILDRKPELKVVSDYINDQDAHHTKTTSLEGRDRFESFARRFALQTQEPSLSLSEGSGRVSTKPGKWKDSAEFKVHVEDKPLILGAITSQLRKRTLLGG